MLNLIANTVTISKLIPANWTRAHFFQNESPLIQSENKPIAQNHESPECAKKAAIARNAPGRSATRI
jgi:hypothetical protein